MNWDRSAQIAERAAGALCLLALGGSAVYFSWDAHKTQVMARAALKDAPAITKNVAGTTGALPGAIKQLGDAAQQIGDTALALASAVSSLGDSAAQLNAVMINLQRPCEVRNVKSSVFYSPFYSADSTMPCGGLADFTRTLATTRDAVGQFEVIGQHVNRNLPEYDRQEALLFSDVHGTFTDFEGYMKSRAMSAFAADIARGVHAGADTAQNVAGITGSMDKITAHLEKTVDSKKPLWQTAIPGAELGAKLWACAWYHVCVD